LDRNLPAIAFVASPLQQSVLNLSNNGERDLLIVGHRGMPGDLSFSRPILNDAKFLAIFDSLLGTAEVEIFLPNSVNLLFYLCVSHPKVKRISFLDEGRLTTNFLTDGYKKPCYPFSGYFITASHFARHLPQRFQSRFFQLLLMQYRLVNLRKFQKNPDDYHFRTIERRWKKGSVLHHAPISTDIEGLEFVDLLKDVNFPKDYEGMLCCFLHPNQIESECKCEALINEICAHVDGRNPILLRPHPLFSIYSGRLNRFLSSLHEKEVLTKFAELSYRQEVTIELYVRGVRTFVFPGNSTIGETISFFPHFFKDIQVVKV